MPKTKEEKRIYDKEYREKNKEKIALQQKQYREKNKQKLALQQKEYNEKNKEKIALQQKELYEKNKEKILKYTKEYYKKIKTENPLKHKQQKMIYHSKANDIKYNRYDKEDHITLEFLQEQHTKQDNKCHYCKIELELTFENNKNPNQITIERLDNALGHITSNCVYACYKCNITSRDNEMECL